MRTTHMTGVVTDIGVVIGHMIARQARLLLARWKPTSAVRVSSSSGKARVDEWKQLKLLSLLFSSFFIGSAVGMGMFRAAGSNALLLPAFGEGAMGLGYFVYRTCLRPRWERLKSKTVAM